MRAVGNKLLKSMQFLFTIYSILCATESRRRTIRQVGEGSEKK